ncbi:MAG: MFS transporter [Phycisphaerales bacterium]
MPTPSHPPTLISEPEPADEAPASPGGAPGAPPVNGGPTDASLPPDAAEQVFSSGAEPQPHAGPPRRGPLGVLRHRHYRNVWIGALISSVGGWMEIVGVQWLMADQAASAMMMAWLAAAQLAPMLVLGVWGGLVADRVNRKRLILITQTLLMLIAAGLAFSAHFGLTHPMVLLAFGALNGVTMAFNVPAWQVQTPRLVPRDELTSAIHLNGLQFNLARVIGPALAGALMALFGPTVLFAINAVSFLGVIVAIAGTPDAPAPPPAPGNAWQRTREAVSFVFHRPGPRAVFIGMVVFAALAAPLVRLMPLFVRSVYPTDGWVYRRLSRGLNGLEAREAAFGLLLAVMGVGAVAGVALLKFIPKWYPKHHFIPLAIACAGASIVVFCLARTLEGALAAVFFCGVFWLWSLNSSFAAMQVLVDDRMRGRVLAVCNVAVFGAMPLGSLAAGAIDDLGAGTAAAVGVLGAALAAAGLVMLVWRTPEVDGIAPGEPGHARRAGLLAGITARAHRPRF